jgi:MoaA/NifB/PqqE/SkfB family radical SAM enzyme
MPAKLTNTSYASLRSGKRISLADTSPIATPLTMYLETTNICNFKCVYCPESFADFEEKSGGRHRLSLNDFSLVAEQIRALGVPKVLNSYMMGEPFANPKTIDFIRIATATRLAERICVTTNGSLFLDSDNRRVAR